MNNIITDVSTVTTIPEVALQNLNDIYQEAMKNKDEDVSVYAVLDDEFQSRKEKYEEEWNGLWNFYNVMQFDDK